MKLTENGLPRKLPVIIHWRKQRFVRAMTRRMYLILLAWTLTTALLIAWTVHESGRRGEAEARCVEIAEDAGRRIAAANAKTEASNLARIDDIRSIAKHVEKAIRIGSPLAYAPALAGLAEHVRRNPGDGDGAATMFLDLIAEVEKENEDAGQPDPDRASRPAGPTQPDARQRDHSGGD